MDRIKNGMQEDLLNGRIDEGHLRFYKVKERFHTIAA